MIEFDRLVTTYDYYDGPLNFTFKTKQDNHLYYAHLIDVIDTRDVYLVIQVSEVRINEAEKGNIDLRTLLLNPESDVYDVVDSNGECLHSTINQLELLTIVSIDAFPTAGSTLIS